MIIRKKEILPVWILEEFKNIGGGLGLETKVVGTSRIPRHWATPHIVISILRQQDQGYLS